MPDDVAIAIAVVAFPVLWLAAVAIGALIGATIGSAFNRWFG